MLCTLCLLRPFAGVAYRVKFDEPIRVAHTFEVMAGSRSRNLFSFSKRVVSRVFRTDTCSRVTPGTTPARSQRFFAERITEFLGNVFLSLDGIKLYIVLGIPVASSTAKRSHLPVFTLMGCDFN